MASNNSSNRGKDEWELTPYELQRPAHEVITDDTEISVPLEALFSELKCAICLDLLNKTMATKCLHRFCSECIVTSLRAGNKKCPTCRTRLVSKRCLRPDPNFDDFISKLYPNREEFNAQRDQIMEDLNQSQGNMVKSITEGLQIQKKNRSYNTKNKRKAQQAKRTSSNNSAPSTSSQVDNNVKAQTNGEKKMKMTSATVTSSIAVCDNALNSMSLDDMELVLKLHPKEMHDNNEHEKGLNKTDLRYIKAPPASTDHGKEFGNGHDVLIYISPTADQYVLLDNSLTLQDVKEKFWNVKEEKPMEIFYSYS